MSPLGPIQRDNYEQTEPATYNNAPLLGLLSRLHGGHSGYNQLLPVILPTPKAIAVQQKPTTKSTSTPSPVASMQQIAVEQKITTSWVSGGRTYYRYSTTVTNKSSKTLKSLELSVSKLYGPLWGLEKSGNVYVFPVWIKQLDAGKSIEFVYIHSASPAAVSVSRYTLD